MGKRWRDGGFLNTVDKESFFAKLRKKDFELCWLEGVHSALNFLYGKCNGYRNWRCGFGHRPKASRIRLF
jgi:hypothetical protein